MVAIGLLSQVLGGVTGPYGTCCRPAHGHATGRLVDRYWPVWWPYCEPVWWLCDMLLAGFMVRLLAIVRARLLACLVAVLQAHMGLCDGALVNNVRGRSPGYMGDGVRSQV